MPHLRLHLLEIHFAKGDEQNHKHKQRQDGVENGIEKNSSLMQCRREGKDEIGQCAEAHRYRQCPVFSYANQIHGSKGNTSVMFLQIIP